MLKSRLKMNSSIFSPSFTVTSSPGLLLLSLSLEQGGRGKAESKIHSIRTRKASRKMHSPIHSLLTRNLISLLNKVNRLRRSS